MSGFERRVYGLVVRMHPAAFRDEFGREMMLDFEDARQSHGMAALYWDAVVSLGRQWTARGFFAQTEGGAISRPSLLSGQYVMICQDEMTPLEFVRGMVVSVAFLTLCGFAEGHVQRSGVLLPVSPLSSRAARSYRADNVSRARGAGGDDAATDDVGVRGAKATGNWNQVPPSSGTGSMETGSTGDSSKGVASRTGGGSVFAAAVAPKLNTALSAGQVGGPQVAFGIAPTIPMRKQILHASAPLPSFEVVSIRPWKRAPMSTNRPPPVKFDPGPGGPRAQMTDRVRMITPTKLLIASAYNLPMGFESRIVGAPDWLTSDQYEIQAKIEESLFAAMQTMTAAQQGEEVALMEQSLLADRFKLKVHFETREMPMYALVVAKGGPKMAHAKDGESSMLSSRGKEQGTEMTVKAATLDQFVLSPLWTPIGGRTVVDETGLKGAYDFTLTWGREQPVAPDAGQESVADAPSIFTAVQEQLGLKLMPTKGPVEVIVIDHIERPSVN